MDTEPNSWEQAKLIIRKYTADMALKAYLVEHRTRGQGRVVNNMSGAQRSPSQSPGKQRKTYNKDNRGTDHREKEISETAVTQDYPNDLQRLTPPMATLK